MSEPVNVETGDNSDWLKAGHDDTGVETPEQAANFLKGLGMAVPEFKRLVLYRHHREKWDRILPKE